jgi:hypothetical protein
MLMIDRLNMSGQRGMFVRSAGKKIEEVIPRLISCAGAGAGDSMEETPSSDDISEIITDNLSKSEISAMSMSVTVCGLMGNPPQNVVDAWNAQYTCMDLLEFAKWMGFSKKCIAVSYSDGNFMFRDVNGKYQRVEEGRASSEIANIMSDKSLKGARMIFSFDIATSPWNFRDIVSACEAFDVKTPEGTGIFKCASGYGGRTFMYTPWLSGNLSSQSCVTGGVHVSLDCGKFVAQWHTVAHMTASLPMVKDGRAAFKVVMLW